MLYCRIIAHTERGDKYVKISNVLGVNRFSFRRGCDILNMREALEAVLWAHSKGWMTTKEDYG